jgi:glucose-6-phosphate 1-dehydrogenase
VSDEAIERLVLIGATGDLAGRFLFPALARLLAIDRLPSGFEVVGAARETYGDEEFGRFATEELKRHAPGVSDETRADLVGRLTYQPVDIEDAAGLSELVGDGGPVVVYLGLPPSTFATAITSLADVELPEGSRIVLEKPFGHDLESAVALNTLIGDTVGEEAVFRVDHFLGLPALHTLVSARLANRMLASVWNGEHVEKIDIVWDETLGLEGRGSFYDQAGALRDVIQNHLLQVLAMVAMEPPSSMVGDELRDRRVEALSAVRILDPDLVTDRTTRARYTEGTLPSPPEGTGESVPDYVDEEGVDGSRATETFAEVMMELDTPRWRGTRFLLRTGKALRRSRKEVVIRFRDMERSPFESETSHELRFGLDDDTGISLHLTRASQGPPPWIYPLVLETGPAEDELPAYSHVLTDVLEGGRTLSIQSDEAEVAWRIVTPIMEAWAEDRVPLQEYAAGSDGPERTLA